MADESAEIESGLLGNSRSFDAIFFITLAAHFRKEDQSLPYHFGSLPLPDFISFFLCEHVLRKCAVGYQTKHRIIFYQESENRIQG